MTRKPETVSFWEGRLPHWEVEDGRYFVTLHLAGAIPQEGQERIQRLSQEYAKLDRHDVDARLKLQRRIYAEMETWLDRSEYVNHLQRPDVAEMIIEALEHRHGRIWNLIEYVVMPNHLHLFFEVLEGGLKQSLEQFKRWTGHQATKLLGVEGERFWQDEWFDHWSRSDEEDERICVYIRQNPEKAKLVEKYSEWKYGSWSVRAAVQE